MFSQLFENDVEEYYKEYKNQNHYFHAFEHTTHKFFQISGFFANEYNMESPIYYMVPHGQFNGMMPYRRSASEIFVMESIATELKNSSGFRVFTSELVLLVALILTTLL